jgi:hypothetical protein
MKIKTLLLVMLGGLVGFVSGSMYTSREIDAAYELSLASKALREDKILTLLEKGDSATALAAQKKYLESTLIQLKDAKSELPDQVKEVLKRREASNQK